MSDHAPDEQPRHEPRRPGHDPGEQRPRHAQHSNKPGDEAAAAQVPEPRSPLDDAPATGHGVDAYPENGLVEPEFRYDQTGKRGKHRRYNGYVERVGGADGDRLREGLAAAIRDLLDWANQDTRADVESERESETDSGKDGGLDDTPA